MTKSMYDIGHSFFEAPEKVHTFAYYLQETIDQLQADIAETQRQVEELRNGSHPWPELMGASQTAEYLGISTATLNDLVRRGHIQFVNPYGLEQRRYRREELDLYIRTGKGRQDG